MCPGVPTVVVPVESGCEESFFTVDEDWNTLLATD
jgi:hypothetical protein